MYSGRLLRTYLYLSRIPYDQELESKDQPEETSQALDHKSAHPYEYIGFMTGPARKNTYLKSIAYGAISFISAITAF